MHSNVAHRGPGSLSTSIAVMKIKEFSVTKLFGYFTYKVPLKGDSIAILHGPNGCGKTTVLKLLKAVADVDLLHLQRTSFEEFRITFFDERVLQVTRELAPVPEGKDEKRERLRHRHTVRFCLHLGNGKKHEFKPSGNIPSPMEFPLSSFERYYPELVRMGPRAWQHRESGEIFNLEDVQLLYGAHLPPHMRIEQPTWLKELSADLSPYLIQTQRLLKLAPVQPDPSYASESQSKTSEFVEIYSAEIKELISKRLAESVTIAQSRDRTFPTRLLTQQTPINIVEAELRQKFNDMEEKRRALIATGMLGDEQGLPLPAKEMDVMEMKVLWLYLQDVEQKLEVFDDLQKRIQAFMEILNKKLNPKGKSINVSREKGFVFESKFGDKPHLAAKDLSSGEQHQVVLFYELLFRTKPGGLILIDEPEISLHVNWQRLFLDDVERVVRLLKQNVVIATHSPQIINNRWDLTAALDGGVQDDA